MRVSDKTMADIMSSLSELVEAAVGVVNGIRRGRPEDRTEGGGKTYDKETQKPVLKCSICNGEQVAGFKDIRTGKFEEVTLVRTPKELDDFMKLYGIDEISKEY